MDLTADEVSMLRTLRDRGYAVVLFNPYELRGVEQTHLEDALVQHGWDVIGLFATEEPEE